MNQLTIVNMLQNSIQLGLKNAASIVGAAVLWALTAWIPYINVGTTIALYGGMIVQISKGETITPLEIFDKKYRQNMGEFFLLMGFMFAGIMAAAMFFYFPAFVVAISWSLALPLFIEKNVTAIEALSLSNKLTYGHKWKIFLGFLVVEIAVVAAVGIVAWIFSLIHGILGLIIFFVGYLLLIAIIISLMAYIYGELSKEEVS